MKITILGIGNCTSSLVQGLDLIKKGKDVIGIPDFLTKEEIKTIDIVGAIDIDKRKVGKTLNEAIYQKPNNTTIFNDNVTEFPIEVVMGNVLDGVSDHMLEVEDKERTFVLSDEEPIDIVQYLKDTKTDILINYLPVGSQEAVEFYANACLEAGVGFINAIPVFIASKKEWRDKFKEKDLILLGDDIKSQVGATIVHRSLVHLLEMRGVKLDKTYQLNVGGNTDFLNMKNQDRLKSKKISKTQSVVAEMFNKDIDKNNIHIGPSDYVPFLNDNKLAFIRLEGSLFGGPKVKIELQLSVEDSPNSAGSMILAILMAQYIKNNSDKTIEEKIDLMNKASAYTFKSPFKQVNDIIINDLIREIWNK